MLFCHFVFFSFTTGKSVFYKRIFHIVVSTRVMFMRELCFLIRGAFAFMRGLFSTSKTCLLVRLFPLPVRPCFPRRRTIGSSTSVSRGDRDADFSGFIPANGPAWAKTFRKTFSSYQSIWRNVFFKRTIRSYIYKFKQLGCQINSIDPVLFLRS